MNRQLPSPASAGQACGSELASWSLLPDFSRQQLAMVTEIACTLFRSSEAMRKIQQEAAHHASLRHEAAMQKLRANCTPVELVAIQTDLLRLTWKGPASIGSNSRQWHCRPKWKSSPQQAMFTTAKQATV